MFISQPLNEDEFYVAFAKDLVRAQALVLVQSPFLAPRRISKLRQQLVNCIRRRVRICFFVRNPLARFTPDSLPELHSQPDQETLEAAQTILDLGAHVTFRPRIHEKVAILDENILWDGSLNIMSQNDSSERMTRFWSRERVSQAIQMHRLDGCITCLNRQLKIDGKTPSANDFFKTIGVAIEKRRTSWQLTQTALANKMGVSQSVVSNIESGKRKAGLRMYQRACCELQLHLRASPWYLSPSLNDWEADIAKTEEGELLNQQQELEEKRERAKNQTAQPLMIFNPAVKEAPHEKQGQRENL